MRRFVVLTSTANVAALDEGPICSWGERHVRAMGSRATIIAGDAPLGLIDWACDELARLEACWSRFLPGSELSELNESAGRWFPMSDTLTLAVDRVLEVSRRTGGLCDPTVLDRLLELGYDRTFTEIARRKPMSVVPGVPTPGIGGIERDGNHVRLPTGTRLDLGGVGKGLGADLLAVGMIERGARSSCVSLGGDIRVAGLTPDDSGWPIPVDDPFGSDQTAGTVSLTDAAIVTSTTLIRRWRRSGRALHHLIDPRTGEPSETDVVAAVVKAPEAWLAEGLAKAAVIGGSEIGAAVIVAEGAVGWLALGDGRIVSTPGAPVSLGPPGGTR